MILWQVVLNLTKLSEYNVILTGKAMDKEKLLQEALETKNDNIRLVLSCYRLCAAFIFDEYDIARLYEDWGAKAKAEQLQEKHEKLLAPPAEICSGA
jgi:hypothetical protein